MVMDRKKSIIKGATKSFTLFGYKATTMDQVARISNVGKGTIYTFFENKEELFDEIIFSLIEEMRTVAEESIHPERSFFENLHNSLYRVLDFRKKHELMMKLTEEVKELGTPTAQKAMQRVEEEIIHFLKSKVQRAIDRGEIKNCDPEITAYVMFKLYLSLVFDWEKNHRPLSKEEIAQLFDLYLVHGLVKSE